MNLGEFHKNPFWASFIILQSTSIPLPIFQRRIIFEYGGVFLSFIYFLWLCHSYSLSSIAILIHSQHLPYSMLFYTKHRIQQLVTTTSICFLASHEGMLIFQRGGGISTHDGCFLFSFSFKAYNFSVEIDFHNIFETMNSIFVIFGKHRRIINTNPDNFKKYWFIKFRKSCTLSYSHFVYISWSMHQNSLIFGS